MHGGDDADGTLLGRLVDGAPVVMIVVDPTGVITFCSDPCLALFGYEPAEIVGTNILEHIELDWNPLALESIGSAFEASGLRLPMVFKIRTKDGTGHVVEVTANSQVDDPVVGGLAVYIRSWNEQSLVDGIIEALAGDQPLEAKFAQFTAVMAAETLQATGAVLHAPIDGRFTRAVAAAGLAAALGADPTGTAEVEPGPAPWDLALATGEPQHLVRSALPPTLAARAEADGLARCWAYPVHDHQGAVHACLVMWRRDAAEMEESFLASIRRLVRLTQLVLEQEEHLARLTYAAHHDPLTGLANRAAFFARFQDLLDDPERDAPVGVLYLDLDGFKPVNDRLGHGAGDTVLETIAQRLTGGVRPGDLVARMGGDEFAVVVPGLASVTELEVLAERLALVAREPIVIGDHTVSVGASVGASVSLSGTCSIQGLVDAADAALFEAKTTNTGSWRTTPLP